MKILICTFSFPYFQGNISDACFVYSEAEGYAGNGAKVTVITPHFPGAPKDEILDKDIIVKRFQYFFPASLQKLRRPGKPIYDNRSILSLLQLPIMLIFFSFKIYKLSKEADIIHAQWTPTALLALPSKYLLGKKIILTARGSDIRIIPKWLNRYIYRNIDAAIDCFGPTSWNLNNIQNFPSNYIKLPHMVRNKTTTEIPEEIKRINQHDGNAFIILFVGRLHPIKLNTSKLPLYNLIHASKILDMKEINFHIIYLGDGTPRIREKMKSLIKEYQIGNRVHLLGNRNDVSQYAQYSNLGIGGEAFNGVSQDFSTNNTPQLLMETPQNENTPWKNMSNCITAKIDDVNDLVEKIIWAREHSEELRLFAKKAVGDMEPYFIESQKGGKLYLNEFTKLLAQ